MNRGRWTAFGLMLVFVALSACPTMAQGEKSKKAEITGEPEEVKTEDMRVTVSEAEVYCLAAGPADGHPVLLMHGARFSSRTWLGTNTIQALVSAGYRVFSIDIPGFANSPRATVYAQSFATDLLTQLTKKPALLITPSLSGRFGFPPAIAASPQVAGWIAIAPAAIDFHKDDLTKIKLPTLVLWGSKDEVFPVSEADRLTEAIVGSKKVVLEGAGHPCYLEQPERFNEAVLAFAASVFDDATKPEKKKPEKKEE